MVGKVCIIGAGPSGLSFLCWFAKLKREGKVIPEMVCYEKQDNWGGLWNYNWRTGSDQYGELVHNSQYRGLWSNGPKECHEFPHYTFEDHFGKPIPSFPPREVIFDYLQGRWKQEDVKKYVKFSTVVKSVVYSEATDDFTVVVKDLKNDEILDGERFDYVIVATGHFSVPNVPDFEGIDKFSGRVMHSHDFRDASEFDGKRLLLIGSSYSAEDIALQCLKFGAKNVVCTWRTKSMGYKWPKGIEERPLLERLTGNIAHFKDGTEAEFDVVIMCTGYLHSYPFLEEDLRLKSRNCFYPPNLYKGIVWQNGGNNKLLYLGVQDQAYSYNMFDIEGLWAVRLVEGQHSLPSKELMENDWRSWVEREGSLTSIHEFIDFQSDYVNDLARDCEFPHDLDHRQVFYDWVAHKVTDIQTYRDQRFTSKYTGNMSPSPHTTFMKAMDDSMKTFLNIEKVLPESIATPTHSG